MNGADDMPDLDSINDENTLKQMLEQSEDLEFRRLVRARLRQLKKETGKTEESRSSPIPSIQTRSNANSAEKDRIRTTRPVESGPKIKVSGNEEFLKAHTGLKKPVVESDPRVEASHSEEFLKAHTGLKKSTVPISKPNEPEKMKLEPISLRSSRSREPIGESPDKFKTAFETPALRQVERTKKSEEANLSSKLKSTSLTTPKDAFARFKEIDATCDRPNRLSAENPDAKRGRSPSPNSIKEQTLNWSRARVEGYENVDIVDFSASWNDGMAFCALIHSFFPEAFDYDALDPKNRKHNFQLAFDTAEKYADLAPLLEAEDMARTLNPDWRCVFTYVNSLATRMAEIRKEQRKSQEDALATLSVT